MEITREERHWLLRNLALGLVKGMGVVEPPVPVEEFLRHPPEHFRGDLGVVDWYSKVWDATFARPPGQPGNIFVQKDLPLEERRYALARETLAALVVSRHGRALGLPDVLFPNLYEAASYFARVLLAPDPMVVAYRKRGGDLEGFAAAFGLPPRVAEQRWQDPLDPVFSLN